MDDTLKEYVRVNKAKIDLIVPKNPSISKDDEWREESEWDDLFNVLTQS